MNQAKEYTKDEVKEWLNSDDRWVVRAILALFKFQTEEEKVSENIKVHNGAGFNSFDAPFLNSVTDIANGKRRG